jgi:MYXO-CTERM domain-containing protein
MRRTLLSALAFAACLFASGRARATAEFPQQIVNDLGITCSNPIWDGSGCLLCHTSNGGGLGTATKPFGVWTKQNGLTPFNDAQLATLLQQLQSASPPVDTNCDGTADIDQLTNCDWLSLASNDQCSAGVPVQVYYGCNAAPTPDSPALPASGAIGVVALLGAAVFRARWRKRSADRDRRSSPR